MNWRNTAAALVLSAGLLAPVAAHAATDDAKEYQVTGVVLEVHDTYVVVSKGDEKWELVVDKETKVDGKLEKGEKVTIHYRMLAKSVDDKTTDKKTPDKK